MTEFEIKKALRDYLLVKDDEQCLEILTSIVQKQLQIEAFQIIRNVADIANCGVGKD